MLKIVLLFITAYLLGSIPSGLWIGQAFFNINIRDHGSGNTGTTNTFRILGPKAGTVVFIVDFLKGTIAALLPILFHVQDISPIVFGLLAVLGHTFPIFAQFKGGKAVATSFGILLALSISSYKEFILIFLIPLLIWLIIKKFTSLVSLASLIALFISALLSLICFDYYKSIVIFILFIFVSYRHKDNIKRLLAGKETKSNY